jgi:DNA-binding LacI/PurR family transcriptional regulator
MQKAHAEPAPAIVKPQATINDVAKLAAVSTATVSRALNQPNLVNDKTLERVRAAMLLCAFAPNVHAQTLGRSRNRI